MTDPHSYHCICSTFIIATNYDLASLPVRRDPALDKAIILPTRDSSDSDNQNTILQSLVADRQTTVIRRDDGFEKRILLKCQRCNLVIGYRLEQAQFKDQAVRSEDVVYILPGALVSTEDMINEKVPTQPEWAQPT